MPNGKDLELLERFTSALDKSRNVGATEIGPDSRVTLHVMPDRVIEAVRARILDLQKRIDQQNQLIEWSLGEIQYIKDGNEDEADKKEIARNNKNMKSHIRNISAARKEIPEMQTLIKRYEEIILRLLDVCIK